MLAKTLARSLKSYTVLKPYVEFESRLCKVSELQANIQRRKLDVNVEEISSFHENFKRLEETKTQLEDSRELVRQRLSQTENLNDENVKRQLTITARIIREDYKQVKSSVLELEQNLIRMMMKVPNELHPKTGDEDDVIHETKVPCGRTVGHLEIGERLGVVEYRSPWAYFLKNEAALFEMTSVTELSKALKGRGFVPFSNPDFSRTIVVDGCEGVNCASIPLSEFEGDQDTTYITGGAALLPFLSFFAKRSLSAAALPVRCYASGRQYSHPRGSEFGLFEVPQTNACQVFILTMPSDDDEEVTSLISAMTDFYRSLDVPFRIVVKGASRLSVAESYRVSFELFSPHFDKFFECGHVSMYGSLVSKNMNIRCAGDNNNKFTHIVSGTVLRVAPLLACILETKTSL